MATTEIEGMNNDRMGESEAIIENINNINVITPSSSSSSSLSSNHLHHLQPIIANLPNNNHLNHSGGNNSNNKKVIRKRTVKLRAEKKYQHQFYLLDGVLHPDDDKPHLLYNSSASLYNSSSAPIHHPLSNIGNEKEEEIYKMMKCLDISPLLTFLSSPLPPPSPSPPSPSSPFPSSPSTSSSPSPSPSTSSSTSSSLRYSLSSNRLVFAPSLPPINPTPINTPPNITPLNVTPINISSDHVNDSQYCNFTNKYTGKGMIMSDHFLNKKRIEFSSMIDDPDRLSDRLPPIDLRDDDVDDGDDHDEKMKISFIVN